MSNSKKTPKKLTMKLGKRSLRTVAADELARVTGGMPADGSPSCTSSPPPTFCFP